MHVIHPNVLWIGHALDAREPRALLEAGIAAVVDVAIEEPPAQLPRELIYCRFPINDGGGNDPSILLHAIQCTVDLLASGTRTIVACSAGMSRSPTIAAFALGAYLDKSPEVLISQLANAKALEIKGPLWNDAISIFPQVRRTTSRGR